MKNSIKYFFWAAILLAGCQKQDSTQLVEDNETPVMSGDQTEGRPVLPDTLQRDSLRKKF
ncbi:hypothetical protein [Arundinibacter roseus]|uniref:Uncharacterized protein n=1 Tax=Arundinibacter roseus TaxID=2070510 RepID=A0A4R4KJF8_9BACT|nr:hypothetical protein [Arundinibacter roseus]TDB68093.1 hypothetical protein EZE20_04000 [Arundinibacter roseus]